MSISKSVRSIKSVITGTGNFIPAKRIRNEEFLSNEFYNANGEPIGTTDQVLIDKFQEITTISERRYVADDMVTSDMAYEAARVAISSAKIDKEELDHIIVAHNFGDIKSKNKRSESVPCLAARVKFLLQIKNPKTVACDLTFGCPGWLQAMVQADYYIRSGDAKKVLVIGADSLSRVSDPHDRDSMLYADGAGATILEAYSGNEPKGILAHLTRSDTYNYARMLRMAGSYHPDNSTGNGLFLKMNGRKIYQFAIETVPQAIKECLEKSKTHLKDIKKVLIHQANGKMDDAILKRLFDLYGIAKIPEHIMPMTIARLGNSSVATVPTLLDLILKKDLGAHQLRKGDTVIFASVGAGMNTNAMIYRM